MAAPLRPGDAFPAGYFANEHGEQPIYTYDYENRRGDHPDGRRGLARRPPGQGRPGGSALALDSAGRTLLISSAL